MSQLTVFHFTMIIETLQLIALCFTVLCSLALLHTAHSISRTLRSTSHQLLDFAAEILDLIDPVDEPSSELVTPPASPSPGAYNAKDLLYDAAHPGWEAPLSPVLSSDNPGSPQPSLPEVAVLSLDEELRRAPSESPGRRVERTRPLSYPGRTVQRKPAGLQSYKRPSLIATPSRVAPVRCGKRDCDGGMKK